MGEGVGAGVAMTRGFGGSIFGGCGGFSFGGALMKLTITGATSAT